MTIQLDVQIATTDVDIPTLSDFKAWAANIPSAGINARACLRIVDEEEARALSKRFRNLDQATSILSFPADVPTEVDTDFLGDVVMCAPLVYRDARKRQKEPVAHYWAHLLVHGVLHLQGYVHDNDIEAGLMEAQEIEILRRLGIDNPYLTP